jgi:hypothetical protein
MMATKTRSNKKMTVLIAAVAEEPTVEAGATLAFKGVSDQLSEAVGADSNGDKLALPNFAATFKASFEALVAAIVADVEPTKTQLDAASQELAVAKQAAVDNANAANAQKASNSGPTPTQVTAADLAQRQANARAAGQPVPLS